MLKLKAKHGKCAKESRTVKPVCLPAPHLTLQPGRTCEIAGYGKEKQGEEDTEQNRPNVAKPLAPAQRVPKYYDQQ